jgi:hypothetical protein
VRLTTYHHPVPLSGNLGTLKSWNPLGLSRPVMGLLYLFTNMHLLGLTLIAILSNETESYNSVYYTAYKLKTFLGFEYFYASLNLYSLYSVLRLGEFSRLSPLMMQAKEVSYLDFKSCLYIACETLLDRTHCFFKGKIQLQNPLFTSAFRVTEEN